ncbi:pitrilysin family protein [Fulvimarina sp. 2208YS6-2-32]|uniref:Pitrilysin family protein n=1 Tax=Fulvimarina uroteuthidis TaxID=3098149 RepID=A0ABU5I3D0_9HYPH|nr:pitrilysin family protein [Fulvimarina sp. 2208YS6-2-32]MDY8109329.1 pitrilysin family protein [Fulvimarina sp. 2208YS6-2-32]
MIVSKRSHLLGLAAFAATLVFPLAARAVEIQTVTSEGGIEALLVEDHTNPLIAMDFAFKGAGSAQDPDGKAGLANLLSGLLDEGAGDIESAEFQRKLDDLGVSLSFDAGRDDFTGSINAITEFSDEAFDLVGLALSDPRFDEEPVSRIRGQIVTGIKASENDPETLAKDAFSETLFGDHPYSRRTEGTVESLGAIEASDLEAFRSEKFAQDNLVVGVVGDITPDRLKTVLDEIFGDLRQSPDLADVADIEPTFGERVAVELAVPQTTIQFALPGVERDDPEFFAAYLMNHILGGGSFTSRLYEEIREKRGLAYGAGSWLASYNHAAILGVSTATRADAAEESIRIIRDELTRMAENGPSEEELAMAKTYVKGSYAVRNLDSSGSIAKTLVGIQLDDLGIDYIDTRKDEIDAVTMEQVKAAAKALLSVEPTVITVGPAGA